MTALVTPRLVKGPAAPGQGPFCDHALYGVQVKPGGAAWRPSDPRHTPMYPQPERPPQITRRVLLSDVRRHGDSAEQQVADVLGDQLDSAARRALLQRAGDDVELENAIDLFSCTSRTRTRTP